MALTNDNIQQRLTEKFGSGVYGFQEPYGILTFTADNDISLQVLGFLFEEEDMHFKFLTDLCGVHYPAQQGAELGVVYHLHNMRDNVRIRFSVYVPVANPKIYTATGMFSAANWMERETYDFYGIEFIGHPNLKRILNVDEMDYFPMRKEYPLEDAKRQDKDDEMFGRTQGNVIDWNKV